jgi:NAD(P)H dehydrogenase (quinone)
MALVAGTTGHAGCAVVYRLASLGDELVAMVRDVDAASRRLPSGIARRVADYADASLKRARAGIDDMVLIWRDGDASAVMRHHANAMEAAAATNIRHIRGQRDICQLSNAKVERTTNNEAAPSGSCRLAAQDVR